MKNSQELNKIGRYALDAMLLNTVLLESLNYIEYEAGQCSPQIYVCEKIEKKLRKIMELV